MGFAQSGIKEAVVIENFCHRPDCRTWITVDGFLIDRNGRTQPFHMFHPWFFRLAQKLSGISREGFDKPTLTLLENRVKCQRRFSEPPPVNTVRVFLGRVRLTFFRLCSDAPTITISSEGPVFLDKFFNVDSDFYLIYRKVNTLDH